MIYEVNGFRLSWHAEQRAAERNISNSEIRDAVTRPGLQYQQLGRYAGREIRAAGRISVVIDTRTRMIVTLLFRSPAEFLRLQARGKPDQRLPPS